MLVKIKSIEGNWILIDNAEELEYSGRVQILQSEEDLNNLLKNTNYDELVTSVRKRFPERVKSFVFKRNSVNYFVVFSTVTYICDNSGKTLEALKIER